MTPSRQTRRAAVVLAASLLLAACTTTASGTPTPSRPGSIPPSAAPSVAPSMPGSEEPADPSGAPDDGLGAFVCNQPLSGGTTTFTNIVGVRVGEHDGYDRITFEFNADVPEFRVEPATPPLLADGSGLEIDVSGDAFLQITLLGATKLAPNGTVTYGGPRDFLQDYDELVHLVEGGDFEAVSTWYAGLKTDPCIRVLTLSDPSRIAVDIQH